MQVFKLSVPSLGHKYLVKSVQSRLDDVHVIRVVITTKTQVIISHQKS